MIREGDDPAALLAEFKGAPCILEGFVPFEREISVVAARGPDGTFAAYDPCANEHSGPAISNISTASTPT
jgi:5-(carboxyamino)imidazole ribonucleotide synthase